MALYRGFSTVNRSKKFRQSDFEVVKQDIYNHFSIRKGEKLMQPDFGSIIWNLMFEPLTEEIQQLIVDDVKRIAGYDPRVSIDNVVVTQVDQAIQIELSLRYLLDDQTSLMNLAFSQNSKTLTRN